MMLNALARQYLFPGFGPTPVEQNMMASSMYPQGSPQSRMLSAAAAHAAGIAPTIGGQRPGVPIRSYNPQTGNYDITGQNPRVGEGMTFGGNGQVSVAPGYLPAMAATEATRANVANQLKYGNLYGAGAANAGAAATASHLARRGSAVRGGAVELDRTASAPGGDSHGTLLPPLSQQGPLGPPAQIDAAIPAWQKKVTDWTDALAPAQQAEQRLWTIAHTFTLLQSGAFQTNRADIAAGLKALDLPPMVTDPGQVETALHENYLQTLTRLKATTSRFTQQEFRVVSENSEHPNLQPEANLQMLSEDIASLRRAQYLPQDWGMAQQLGWHNPQAFEAAWTAANPMSQTVRTVKDLIGPLKGMPGYQPPTQGMNATQPAVPQIAHDPQTGREIIVRGGQWVDRQTGQPIIAPPIAR